MRPQKPVLCICLLAILAGTIGAARAQDVPRGSDPLYLVSEAQCGPNGDDTLICIRGTLALEEEMLACWEDYCRNNCCDQQTPCSDTTCQEPDAVLVCPSDTTVVIEVGSDGTCTVSNLSTKRRDTPLWIVRVRMRCRDGSVRSGRGYGDTYCEAWCRAYNAARRWCNNRCGATCCYCIEIIQRPCRRR